MFCKVQPLIVVFVRVSYLDVFGIWVCEGAEPRNSLVFLCLFFFWVDFIRSLFFFLEIFLEPKIFRIDLGFLSFCYLTTVIINMLLTKMGNMHCTGFQWQ